MNDISTIIFDLCGVLVDEDTLQLIAEGQELAQWFAQQHKNVYILTNASDKTMAIFIEKNPQFFHIFKAIVTPQVCGYKKPDPRTFEYILRTYGHTAQECLFIDDSQANIETAKSLGMQTIWISSPEALPLALKKVKTLT